jgi:hypothetical protein
MNKKEYVLEPDLVEHGSYGIRNKKNALEERLFSQ